MPRGAMGYGARTRPLGGPGATCAMVQEETPQFPREQCEELARNYDQVLAQLQKQEALHQPLSTEAQPRIAAKGAPSFGPEDAKVTIVEFSDFQCPYCARTSEVVAKIRERHANEVRFVFRQGDRGRRAPADQIALHPQAGARCGACWSAGAPHVVNA